MLNLNSNFSISKYKQEDLSVLKLKDGFIIISVIPFEQAKVDVKAENGILYINYKDQITEKTTEQKVKLQDNIDLINMNVQIACSFTLVLLPNIQ